MTDYRFKPKKDRREFGWHDRGYIPHFDGGQFSQFITFRLADSMPQKVLQAWNAEDVGDVATRKRIEQYLDAGHGACWLADQRVAEVVRSALTFHDGAKYRLNSWVIMPNHVHALLTPADGMHLPEILHSIKSFTAQKANKILDRTGQFWQNETFDRYIRNREHFVSVIRYIENNPVKAGLCERPEMWRFGSAYERNFPSEE
jgi:REP element-mobilizing transposase RayT